VQREYIPRLHRDMCNVDCRFHLQ